MRFASVAEDNADAGSGEDIERLEEGSLCRPLTLAGRDEETTYARVG